MRKTSLFGGGYKKSAEMWSYRCAYSPKGKTAGMQKCIIEKNGGNSSSLLPDLQQQLTYPLFVVYFIMVVRIGAGNAHTK